MPWDIERVRSTLSGKLIGSLFMREMVCKTILLLPDELIEQVSRGVWFISSQDDAWALTFRGEDLKERHLIFLSDKLLMQTREQITFTILHEIGHVVLNHRNSIGYMQTESEIEQQEDAADLFARTHLTTIPL